MITIKDIAKAAGVAQGTVSNVLNGKGNVSSQKIKLVLSAAASLGYIPNEHAKLLSKGQSNLLAVILPNIRSKQYLDFYMGFKVYSENHNFSVIQYLTNDDNPESEAAAYKDIQSLMPTGTAVFSSCPNAEKEGSFYLSQDDVTNGNTIFVERCPEFPCNYIGFNYEKAGSDMEESLTPMCRYLIPCARSFFTNAFVCPGTSVIFADIVFFPNSQSSFSA